MCGVFGAWGEREYLDLIITEGLFGLQHRGQEAAGLALSSGDDIAYYRDFGLVPEALGRRPLAGFRARAGIGHTRYSTFGGPGRQNIQPLVVTYRGTPYAIAHNGNISNALLLRDEMEAGGKVFHTTSDTEVILSLYITARGDPFQRMREVSQHLMGAYSLLILDGDRLLGVRDPRGFRPLSIGKLGDIWLFSSEPSAFGLLGARYLRDLRPGEMVLVEEGRLRSGMLEPQDPSQCAFELIYFSRPDSTVFGVPVHEFRKACGRALARRDQVPVDVVVPVPDSGLSAALGYSRERGVPMELGLVRNHYTGRSFILPAPKARARAVREKLLPIGSVLEGKRVALVDDSIVRGTTSRLIVQLVREWGAREVHLRIASPPIVAPCFFGIDMPTREELLASDRDPEAIAEFLGADSVLYLDLGDMMGVLGDRAREFCYACFTGEYPPGSLPAERPYRQLRP